MSLSSRLAISYALIILITLFLAFFTLIVASRPIQNRVAQAQLKVVAGTAATQLNRLARVRGSQAELIDRVNSAATGDVRLLLTDAQGLTLADSGGSWIGQPLAIGDGDPQGQSLAGNFRDPDRNLAMYAAEALGASNQTADYVVAVRPRAPLFPNVIRDLAQGFMLAGLVALLISLLVGVVLARTIALPLQRIAQAAGAVAAGDYRQRVPVRGPPEIRRVSDSFNTMADRVQASQQTMRDFVSNVSHELKTPLTSIQGFAQALAEGEAPDEASRQRAAGIIFEEAARMRRLVEALLDLARIESGQIVMQQTPLDVGQILESTVERLLPQAAKKDIQISQAWDRLPPVIGDGDRLAQVFTNLLDNALRHTPAGGRVTIVAVALETAPAKAATLPGPSHRFNSAVPPTSRIEIRLSDTGPGIPPADLPRIFERFYQVDKSRKRSSGAGLGLAIIKEIVEAHQGTISAESTEGYGTTFVIKLPVAD